MESSYLEVKNNEIILDGKYKDGDVIVGDSDNDRVDELYKLRDVRIKGRSTVAHYSEPDAKEVYKEIDVFFNDTVEISEDNIKKADVFEWMKAQGIVDAFVSEAYADENDIDINTVKSGEIEFKLKDKKNKSREIGVKFGVEEKLLFIRKNDMTLIDNSMIITNKLSFSIKGSDAKSVEKNVRDAIKKRLKKKRSSKSEYNKPLLPITIPIVGPVSAYVDIGMIGEATFDSGFYTEINTEVGMKCGMLCDGKKKDTLKVWSSCDGSIDSKMMLKGEVGIALKGYAEAGVTIPVLIKCGVRGEAGPYADLSGCLIAKHIPKKPKVEGYYDIDIGLIFAAKAKVRFLTFKELKIPIFEHKKSYYHKENINTLKKTSLKKSYIRYGDKVEIGRFTATYLNRMTGKVKTESIEKSTLYVDGKKTNVKGGTIQGNIKKGKHVFKLVWKSDGRKYEDQKNVLIQDPEAAMGNSSSNLANRGIVVEAGDTVYVANMHGAGSIGVVRNGKQQEPLLEGLQDDGFPAYICGLNYKDGYIYFIAKSKPMVKYGSSEERSSYYIGRSIYRVAVSKRDRPERLFYCGERDNKYDHEVHCRWLCLVADKLFFYLSDSKLYSMNLDGSNRKEITKAVNFGNLPATDGENIYFLKLKEELHGSANPTYLMKYNIKSKRSRIVTKIMEKRDYYGTHISTLLCYRGNIFLMDLHGSNINKGDAIAIYSVDPNIGEMKLITKETGIRYKTNAVGTGALSYPGLTIACSGDRLYYVVPKKLPITNNLDTTVEWEIKSISISDKSIRAHTQTMDLHKKYQEVYTEKELKDWSWIYYDGLCMAGKELYFNNTLVQGWNEVPVYGKMQNDGSDIEIFGN